MTSTNRHTSLRELRTFCVAAEHSSFREAAERLFVTVHIAVVAAAFAASLLSVSAQAEDPEAAYTMIAITDVSYGDRVTSGRYQQAIEKITTRRVRNSEFFESKTNLCVAYTKSGDF